MMHGDPLLTRGNLNTRVGDVAVEGIISGMGYTIMNEHGEMIELRAEKGLMIGNTLFK